MKTLMKSVASIEEFEALSQEKTVFVFSAEWCPDCVFIKPFMPEIISTNTGFNFRYVDRDQFIDLCKDLDIFGIPSFVVFESGKEIGRYVDKKRKTKAEIQAFLDDLN